MYGLATLLLLPRLVSVARKPKALLLTWPAAGGAVVASCLVKLGGTAMLLSAIAYLLASIACYLNYRRYRFVLAIVSLILGLQLLI